MGYSRLFCSLGFAAGLLHMHLLLHTPAYCLLRYRRYLTQNVLDVCYPCYPVPGSFGLLHVRGTTFPLQLPFIWLRLGVGVPSGLTCTESGPLAMLVMERSYQTSSIPPSAHPAAARNTPSVCPSPTTTLSRPRDGSPSSTIRYIIAGTRHPWPFHWTLQQLHPTF